VIFFLFLFLFAYQQHACNFHTLKLNLNPNPNPFPITEELRSAHGTLVDSASFPEGTASVAVAEDSRGWTWFIASSAEVSVLEKQALWIESLLYAPVS
jgi:hypothetical protein